MRKLYYFAIDFELWERLLLSIITSEPHNTCVTKSTKFS